MKGTTIFFFRPQPYVWHLAVAVLCLCVFAACARILFPSVGGERRRDDECAAVNTRQNKEAQQK